MIGTLLLAMALAAQTAPEPVSITPAQFAQALQGMVGQPFQGGVTITRIYADGQIVVILLDGPPGWRASASAGQATNFIGTFCEDRDFEYFVNGNAMRVDTTEAGAAILSGPVVRACPPPAPGAHPQ